MEKTYKGLIQSAYVQPDIYTVAGWLRYKGYTANDIMEAFNKAEKIYLVDCNWQSEYQHFLNATLYERGKKERTWYGCRFTSLPFWKKWRMRKNYQPLPMLMSLHWIFLVIFVENTATASQVARQRRFMEAFIDLL